MGIGREYFLSIAGSGGIEDWDSLEHINLLAAVEQEFGVKFNMGQVVSMKNVGEMADIIISQLND